MLQRGRMDFDDGMILEAVRGLARELDRDVPEARLGLALLPNGRRRQALELAFEQLLTEDLEERVLDFDRSAAEAAAGLAAERQRNGRTVDMRDTQIAGIVIARRATLATRNVKHFADLTAEVVNPWGAKR